MQMNNRIKPLTLEETKLKEEMKERCLTKGQYIDEKAKDKFNMLCHLEDFEIQYFNLLQENKELHNKIDEISEFIKENKIKRYRPIEGEEYDEEIVLDEDDITCLERIINDEYDYENR